MSKNKFYELNDPKAEDPEQDKDILDQDWFFAFKEERNILESYKYLGECFNYSLFLDNKPAFLVGDEYISIYPMSPNI